MNHLTMLRVLTGLFAAALLVAAGPRSAAATELGVDGTRFTLDGKPAFLLGISYYGALGASEAQSRQDLDDIGRAGFRWVRVWATWSAFGNDVSAVDAAGRARQPFLGKLKRLVEACDRRGMVVDVTLSRGNGVSGPPRLGSLDAHRRAVETIVSALKGRRNWYLDLANERNIKDKRFVGFDELRVLRDAAKKIDPRLLVTASHAGNLGREDVRQYLEVVRVDFLSPHGARNPKAPGQYEARTRECLRWVKDLGRRVPVHWQEPFRRGFSKGWEPGVEDYLTSARGVRAGGAAGWCLHNGDQRRASRQRPRRSFDLRDGPLFAQLDDVERKAIEVLKRSFATATANEP